MTGYENILSQTIQDMPPSGIRKFFDIVSTMKDAISLSIGEPDFTTPWNVCESAIYSIEKGHTHYTSNWGILELRQAIAKYMARFDLSYNPVNEILVTVGASEGIDLAMRALCNPGDEVLLPDPSFVAYAPCVKMAGGVPIPIHLNADNGFRLTAEQLRQALTPKTKAIVLPFPNNPTGGVMEKDDLEAIAQVLRDTDVIVISDEIYAELTYGQKHVSIASLEGMWERTIVLNGFSKAFAMTGWRMGYLCAPAPLAAALCKIHQYTLMCAPVMGQMGSLEALTSGLENDFETVQTMVRSYDRRRRLMVDGLRAVGLDCFEPLGAFYAFPSIRCTGMSSEEFAEKLLYEQNVAVVPGNAFGESGEGYVRCCYATAADKIEEALSRIGVFVAKYAK